MKDFLWTTPSVNGQDVNLALLPAGNQHCLRAANLTRVLGSGGRNWNGDIVQLGQLLHKHWPTCLLQPLEGGAVFFNLVCLLLLLELGLLFGHRVDTARRKAFEGLCRGRWPRDGRRYAAAPGTVGRIRWWGALGGACVDCAAVIMCERVCGVEHLADASADLAALEGHAVGGVFNAVRRNHFECVNGIIVKRCIYRDA